MKCSKLDGSHFYYLLKSSTPLSYAYNSISTQSTVRGYFQTGSLLQSIAQGNNIDEKDENEPKNARIRAPKDT